MPLNWQTFSIPLSSGMDTLPDKRALPPTELAVCRDAEFVPGGIETRKPYQMMGAGAVDGARKLAVDGDELLLFDKGSLYSWSARDDGWRFKGVYAAAATDEKLMFQRAADQSGCDRAEVNGCVVYAWTDATTTTSVFVAATDSVTGAVLLPPTAVRAATSSRPRVFAVGSHVLLFFSDTSGPSVRVLSIDPDDLAGSIVVTPTVVATSTGTYYDADLVIDTGSGPGVFVANRNSGTSGYGCHLVLENLSISGGIKSGTCDGPIAVAVAPDSIHVQVLRTDGANLVGDYIVITSLANVHAGRALGNYDNSPFNQIAAAFNNVLEGGQYRCHYFFSSNEGVADEITDTRHGWVDTGGTVGLVASSAFVRKVGVASRAFAYNGHVYCWFVFAGINAVTSGGQAVLEGFSSALQNTLLLYREDRLFVGKALCTNAGGYVVATGNLPGVQNTEGSTFHWAGVSRRIVAKATAAISTGSPGPLVAAFSEYEARTPCDISLTFDSNEARRTAKLGETLYIDGMVAQYDGTGLAEVGFAVFPRFFELTYNNVGAKAHTPSPADYSYLNTYSWTNARGELERSTTGMSAQITYAASGSTDVVVETCKVTNKELAGSPVAVEVWATKINPNDESPFFLVTGIDPSVVSGSNCYLPNDVTQDTLSLNDADNDSVVGTFRAYPDQAAVIHNVAPPPARIIYASQDRLFLAGVPGRPNTIVYSRLRGAGEVASFGNGLAVDIPPAGGDITGISVLDETLIVFRESAIYALPGTGFSNTVEGSNYGPPRRLGGDIGAVSAECIAITPMGLFFKSKKGWYLLGGGSVPQYVGAQVAAFDNEEVLAVTVIEDRHQIRCVTNSRILMFDYRVKQWSEWTIANAISAVVWQGRYVYLASDGTVNIEQSDYSTGVNYGLDIESAWINFGQLQAYGAVREMAFLGEFRSAFRLRLRIAYDYADSDADGPAWVDDKILDTTPTVVGGPFQLIHGPRRHKAQAFKVRLTACSTLSLAPPTGEALKLTGMTFEIGLKRGIHKRLPATQKS